MRLYFLFIVLLCSPLVGLPRFALLETPARAQIALWDALPALEVKHLQGELTGQSVCPICRHGYDAGVLVFLPSHTSALAGSRIRHALLTGIDAQTHPRFRSIIVLTGSAPSAELLSALGHDRSNWLVAHLTGAALAEAERLYALPLQKQAQGFVFAQRRVLWHFTPNSEVLSWNLELQSAAQDALSLLAETYAQPITSQDPDTPKGKLWLAPSKLTSSIALRESSGKTRQLCLPPALGTDRAHALLALIASTNKMWWAKTDASGCVQVSEGPHEAFALQVFQRGSVWRGVWPQNAAQPHWHIKAASVTAREPMAPWCDGCEAVLQGMPDALSSRTWLTPANEAGAALQLHGTVRDIKGMAQAGVVIYAYQTDAEGRYRQQPDLTGAAARHGSLRAWARTDQQGRYVFYTIRPGAYPNNEEPEHIHLIVLEPGRCAYYLDDVVFAGDPRLKPDASSPHRRAIGGSGLVRLHGDALLGWRAERDIVLRKNLPEASFCEP
jgi:protocatechuate 3,4-dioxygenase beta subunit